MRKGRKGAGPTNAVEKYRQDQQDLESQVGSAVFRHIENDPDWFEKLPDGVQASILQGRLPKPQPVNQDLESSFLSLTASLEHLPDIEDLSAECLVLQRETKEALKTAQYHRDLCRQLEKELKRKQIGIGDYAWLRPLLKQAYEDGVTAGKDRQDRAIPEEEWDRVIERRLTKKQAKPEPILLKV